MPRASWYDWPPLALSCSTPPARRIYPLSHRSIIGHRSSKSVVGHFVNHSVLRNDVSGNPTFRQLVRQARDITVQAYAHEDLPFAQKLGVANPLQHPLCRVVLNVFPPGDGSTSSWPGLDVGRFSVPVKDDPKIHFAWAAEDAEGGWLVISATAFSAETAAQMASDLARILAQGCANPDLPLSLLSPRARVIPLRESTAPSVGK